MKTSLTVLSDAELVERFNALAVEMGFDSKYAETRSYNRRFTSMAAIEDELFHRGRLGALLPGMRNEDPWIQYFSAAYCRSIAPTESLEVVERLAKLDTPGSITYPGSVAGEARISLDIIRRGDAVERHRSPRE